MNNNEKQRGYNKGNESGFNGRFQKEWIQQGINEDGIDYCKELGKYLSRANMSSSQLRNVFSELKRIEVKGFEEEKTSFYMLRPKVAYAVARANERDRGNGVGEFGKMFQNACVCVQNGKEFKNLVNLCEAVIAYFKEAGGK